MSFLAGKFDVAVIGAGHAGIEAALASARLGCNTAAFTINMDAVGNCPCNPSIGGTAKGHLVREIDALGGEMGKTADESMLQMRMLNRGKGPAVHSLRAQIDRRKYSSIMKHKMELQRNLQVHQAEIVSIKKQNDLWLLETRLKAQYECKAVIIATGTFLGGRVYVGDVSYESGPDGIFPAAFLGQSLKELGLSLRRFKTGTPARVLRSSINFSELEEQLGDEPVTPFSYDTKELPKNKVKCHISWTNDNTKKITLSEVVTLEIKAQPSVVTFKDKNGIEHDLFSEVFRRGQNGGIYEVIKTDAIKNITLDHSIPVSCILELKHDDFPTIEELNRQYDEYVNKKPGKSPSKLAAEFAPCNIDKQSLLKEMKNLLFKYGQLTIMERRSNESKNNYFSYCSVNEWSNCSHFKNRYKDLFK